MNRTTFYRSHLSQTFEAIDLGSRFWADLVSRFQARRPRMMPTPMSTEDEASGPGRLTSLDRFFAETTDFCGEEPDLTGDGSLGQQSAH